MNATTAFTLSPATVVSAKASPATATVLSGATVTITLTMDKILSVSSGSPTLSLNDGGTATFDSGHSGGTVLVFNYTVLGGQNHAGAGGHRVQCEWRGYTEIPRAPFPIFRRNCHFQGFAHKHRNRAPLGFVCSTRNGNDARREWG